MNVHMERKKQQQKKKKKKLKKKKICKMHTVKSAIITYTPHILFPVGNSGMQ